VFEQTYSVFAKNAADFNLQWIEMVRVNTNSALDFSRQVGWCEIAVRVPGIVGRARAQAIRNFH
jgi:hypothetical protein